MEKTVKSGKSTKTWSNSYIWTKCPLLIQMVLCRFCGFGGIFNGNSAFLILLYINQYTKKYASINIFIQKHLIFMVEWVWHMDFPFPKNWKTTWTVSRPLTYCLKPTKKKFFCNKDNKTPEASGWNWQCHCFPLKGCLDLYFATNSRSDWSHRWPRRHRRHPLLRQLHHRRQVSKIWWMIGIGERGREETRPSVCAKHWKNEAPSLTRCQHLSQV